MNGLKSSRPIRPHERRVAARLLDGNGPALGTPLAALLAADASTPVRIADLPIDAGVANGNGNTGNFNGNGNAGSFSGNFNGSSFNGNAVFFALLPGECLRLGGVASPYTNPA